MELYEDTERLTKHIDNLISDMKGEGWLFSDDMYVDAKDVFLDSLADEEYDVPPSKMFLAAKFTQYLHDAWENEAERIIEEHDSPVMLFGDTRQFHVMAAPRNDKGFTSLLVSPERIIVAPLTPEATTTFHEYNRKLNAHMSRKW